MLADRRAFTLAEVVLGLAVLSLVGLSVAGLSVALSNAYADGEEFQRSLQTSRSTMLKLQSTIRKARLITGQNGNDLLLWTDDGNEDGGINLTEVKMLRWEPSSGEIREFRIVIPESISPALREAFNFPIGLDTLVTNPGMIASMLSSHVWSEERVLAGGVSGLALTGEPSIPTSCMLKMNITAGSVPREASLRSVVKLRADATGCVKQQDGTWVLD